MLSGFVPCHVHPVIIGSTRKHAVADFLISRLARIYPLHAFMLAAFALVVVRFGLMDRHGTGLPRVSLEFCTGAVLRTLLPYWIDALRKFLHHLAGLPGQTRIRNGFRHWQMGRPVALGKPARTAILP